MNKTTDTASEISTGQDEVAEVPLLNDAQRLHLRVSCEYMDKMLQEIEGILYSAEGLSPFTKYRLDLSPAQSRVLEDYIRRFRSQILRALAWQHIQPPPPNIPATRSIATHLTFIDIAISELRPNQMRNSGALSARTAAELTGVLGELSSIYEHMMSYVKFELDESLQERVDKLICSGNGPSVLKAIESMITARGLVEFRPRLDMLLSRLEDSTFEVAVFGRVSSGKSSFLDVLLQTDLLPVGANPITAVPTRVQYGDEVKATVQLGNGVLGEVSLDRFRALISEARNPGNREGVRYAMLSVPSDRLRSGIVLVDTPGLGSLALKGAQETLAYLPSCDLAIVLIDAGSTLTREDIGTLRLVHEAGISALVLLSKADLLREEDRVVSVEYIRTQIDRELRLSLPVHAISALDDFRWTVDEFYKTELEPRFGESQNLRKRSVLGKLARLQRDVTAALEVRLEHFESTEALDPARISSLERALTAAAGSLGNLDRVLEDRILALSFEAPALVERVARKSLSSATDSKPSRLSTQDLKDDIQEIVRNEVAEMVALLRNTAQRVIEEVLQVGRDLKSRGLPDEKEILDLIRDAPRFELPQFDHAIEMGLSRHLGLAAMRKHLVKAVSAELQPTLHRELQVYSPMLDSWAKHVVRNIQIAVNAYADVYRASIQQILLNPDLAPR